MLTYTLDKNKEEILLDENNAQVMMAWEKPYMEACIDKLQPNGNVLEIGFGMGYSATQIQKYNPKSHTIIEMDPVVIKRLKKWAKNYNNIIIVEGIWQKELHKLGKFDEIFFDDFPLYTPKNDMQKSSLIERFPMFIDLCRYNHSNPNTKISGYIDDPLGAFKKRMIESTYYKYKEYTIDIPISDNCKYHRDNKGIIPIISYLYTGDTA